MELTFRPPNPYFHWINPMEVVADCEIYKVGADFPYMTYGVAP